MKKKLFTLLLIFISSSSFLVKAGGISVDAGLTPAQNRFILRTQYRYMTMTNPMMITNTQMIPLVLAYGVTPGFSLMTRGMYVYNSFSNSAEVKSGFNDLYVLSKFRLYRKNTANYVLGIAPHIASNVPIGNTDISERTWNPELGLNISFRPRFFSIDISASYTISDVLKQSTIEQGNVLGLNTAFSAIIPLKDKSNNAISPVVEMSYIQKGKNKNDNLPNKDLIFISPGVSFIHSSLVFEGLIQIPVYQTSSGEDIMNQKNRYIIGMKYMF